jgi:hypothetical protein
MTARDSHRRHSPKKQKSKGTGMRSPILSERQPINQTNGYNSTKTNQV